MSLIPTSASYAEHVAAVWQVHSGRMLSCLDLDLVLTWQERGIPRDAVAAGIAQAFRSRSYDTRPGEPPVRSLRGCRFAVERAFDAWRRRQVGAHHPETP